MNYYRVTKYDPQKRDAYGNYLDDSEWTSFSEVGTKVGEEEYLNTETNYIQAITAFMDEAGVDRLYVNALEMWTEAAAVQEKLLFLSDIWIGKAVRKEEITEMARLTLREAVWCKLSFRKEFFVHFGYDYYMFIGTNKDCPQARRNVLEAGLFVEEFRSPYLA
ncbi:hypothetical protein [Bacillus infantis]|uniref:hypothetical protein n=1 Tax=Bacillus infantis TaxID=324767 RepID=UPI00209FDD66|nr:hypothetical protein [Bacillus infantis]MCP1161074.1 hypothetical protein [Bacillus infantis]